MGSSKEKLLFIYTKGSTFIDGDLKFLSKHYEVKELNLPFSNPFTQLISFIKESLWLLFNIQKYNIVYIWFADYHSFPPSFLAKLFNKKCFIVIGGYDACRFNKFKYGSFTNRLRGYMTKRSIKMATATLCVSRHIKRIINHIAPNTPSYLVYNGIRFPDSEKTKLPADRAINSILCVALVNRRQSFYIKGIDRYINLAHTLPMYNFTLIGVDLPKVGIPDITIPSNLKVISRLEHSELTDYFHKSKVYCQLSRRESFSLALAEAMFHGCIPLTTNTGGMPEVSGGLGETIYALDSDSFNKSDSQSAIHDTINSIARLSAEKDDYSPITRERVLALFTIEKREKEITAILRAN